MYLPVSTVFIRLTALGAYQNFWTLRVGAYSRCALIRGWALIQFSPILACRAGVFFEGEICSQKHHVETSRREEEMGRVKGSGEGTGRENIFFLLSPSPISFFRPRTYRKGYYFYFLQSSTVIKSKMAATAILRTRTRFRLPKIRLHCRLHQFQQVSIYFE